VRRYIGGFHIKKDDTHFEGVRRFYDALEDLYPWGGNDLVISQKTNIPLSTCLGYLTHALTTQKF
jgi:hypothetical protein